MFDADLEVLPLDRVGLTPCPGPLTRQGLTEVLSTVTIEDKGGRGVHIAGLPCRLVIK